ncbi:TetR/AcrR family transcriptional regulator [Amycolatopsis anabasis]|uniref:TetR/AcrR family transcriptional regulator n=1 Tax=Amycolatopsis anabasis TaxID=1840409 RepID=UPI00131B06A4|nr:TetR/AcrR family transcriptional regulator [Amycolatopsis anabasis]
MPRLTRAESQARTRERLIETARELFLRDGYLATSLSKVAEEAGYSTGAVYSNFEGKSALALVVLDRIRDETLSAVAEIFAEEGDIEEKLTAFEKWAETTLDGGWPRVELEFALEARQEPALVGALADRQRSLVGLIAKSIDRQLPRLGLDGLLPSKALARSLVSLAVGVAIQRMVDPKVPVSGLTDLIRAALAATPRR